VKSLALCFQKALKLGKEPATVYLFLGDFYLGLGRVPAAMAAHRKVISLNPADSRAYFQCGIALARQGQLQEAI
jgi:tetratricopeptide (TPR) repeat protein